MSQVKAVLTQIQQNEKNYNEVVDRFASANFDLNLCKLFLKKILEVNFNNIGAASKLKMDITEFLENLK